MIPKIIHYCWFGKGKKSAKVLKCIASWHIFFPDYQYIEWSEENCDLSENVYVRQAYEAKKYAFVSDYFRIKALYQYGGIYFDTDYEVIQPMDDLLKEGKLITGLESIEIALTAMIAVEPKNCIMGKFLDTYAERKFIDFDGKMDLTPINQSFSFILRKYGVDLENDKYQV